MAWPACTPVSSLWLQHLVSFGLQGKCQGSRVGAVDQLLLPGFLDVNCSPLTKRSAGIGCQLTKHVLTRDKSINLTAGLTIVSKGSSFLFEKTV